MYVDLYFVSILNIVNKKNLFCRCELNKNRMRMWQNNDVIVLSEGRGDCARYAGQG